MHDELKYIMGDKDVNKNEKVKDMEKYKSVIKDLKDEISNRKISIKNCETVLNDTNISLDVATLDNLRAVIEKNSEVICAISKILKKYEEN